MDAGPLEEVPTDRCVAAGDGACVLVRIDGAVLAFPNRCLHQDSRLEGGVVVAGTLQCPLHFWRYRLPDGEHVGRRGRLTPYPTVVRDGRVFVDLPDAPPPMSLREQMLAHARAWDRGDPQ